MIAALLIAVFAVFFAAYAHVAKRELAKAKADVDEARAESERLRRLYVELKTESDKTQACVLLEPVEAAPVAIAPPALREVDVEAHSAAWEILERAKREAARIRAEAEAFHAEEMRHRAEAEAHHAQAHDLLRDLDLKIATVLDAGLDEACAKVARETEAACVAKYRAACAELIRRHEAEHADLRRRCSAQAAALAEYEAELTESRRKCRTLDDPRPALDAITRRLMEEVNEDALQEMTATNHAETLARLEELAGFLRSHGASKSQTDALFDGLESRHRELVHSAIAEAAPVSRKRRKP